MDSDQKKSHENNVGRESTAPEPIELIENSNPKANENIRDRSNEPSSENQSSEGVGSEITDGEDA